MLLLLPTPPAAPMPAERRHVITQLPYPRALSSTRRSFLFPMRPLPLGGVGGVGHVPPITAVIGESAYRYLAGGARKFEEEILLR